MAIVTWSVLGLTLGLTTVLAMTLDPFDLWVTGRVPGPFNNLNFDLGFYRLPSTTRELLQPISKVYSSAMLLTAFYLPVISFPP